MDFLNQFGKQISDLFRSMTPAARIAVGALLAVLVVGLFFLFSGRVAQSGDYIFGGTTFDPAQSQKMQAAFATEGLSGAKPIPAADGYKLKVKGDDGPYIAALMKHDALPPDCYNWVRESLNDASITQSPSAFNASLQNGKALDLQQMIIKRPDIAWAKVMFDIGKPQGFRREIESTATIAVEGTKDSTISAKEAKDIQQMAAGALGIKAADIVVSDIRGNSFSGNLDTGEIADSHLKNDYEAKWQQKIHDLLNIVGMTVAVNVELDPYEDREEFTIKPDKKNVIAEQSYNQKNSLDRKDPGTMGRPGLTANMPNRIGQTGTTMSTTMEKGSESINNNFIPGSKTKIKYATGRPERVNVSIRIPTDYFVDIWKSRNPTPEGEEAKPPTVAELATIETEEIVKTKKSVANLLSRDANASDAAKFVDVATYQSFALEPVEAPGIMAQATAWFSKYWTVVGMFVLAFLSLRVLRTMIRGVPIEIGESAPHKREVKVGSESGMSEEESKEFASEMLQRFEGNPHSLRDELSKLIKQDTDTAANILRGWIGNPTIKT